MHIKPGEELLHLKWVYNKTLIPISINHRDLYPLTAQGFKNSYIVGYTDIKEYTTNTNTHKNNKYFKDILIKNFPGTQLILESKTGNYILINGQYTIPLSKINTITINEIYNKIKTSLWVIDIIPALRGGSLLDAFSSIIQIGQVFLILIDIIQWFIKFVAWFIFFIIWLLKFLFVDLITDFYHSLVLIVVTIFSLPFQILSAIAEFFVNSFGGWLQGFFGWDQSNLTKRDKESNYFQEIDLNKGKKCYLTNTNTVPFSILLGTIICPPLGVFMDMGMSGWLNIFICMILTLLFYIPGLLYALFIIYS